MSANLKAGRFNALDVISSNLNNIRFDWQGNLSSTNKSFTLISKGGIKLDGDSSSRFRSSSGDITIDAESGSIKIDGGESETDAIYLNASSTAGGILFNSGSGGVKTTSTGDISLISSGADINIGLPDDDFDTVNVNNLTRNVQIEATSTVSINSDDFQVLSSDSISLISLSNDISIGDSLTNPAIRISGGDVSIGSSSSTSEGKFVVGVSESSTRKTGYDGIVIKSSNDSVTPELAIKNSTNTGRIVMGVESATSTYSSHQEYIAFKSGRDIVKLSGPDFTTGDIGKTFYWTTEDVSEEITGIETYIGSASQISNTSLIDTHTLTTSGVYTGSNTRHYVIEIDAVHTTPNKFKWSNDGGKTFQDNYVDITSSAITLESGVQITFAETTGYSLENYYTFMACVSAYVNDSATYLTQEAYTLKPNMGYLVSETETDFKIGTSGNERIRITADGNIGINTNQPLSTFHLSNLINEQKLVNTTTSGIQIHPVTATLVNGGYVIIWESQNSDASNYDIYGQIYHPDGRKNGNEFVVNNTTTNNQSFPYVVGNTNTTYGGFIVVWASEESSNTGIYDIKAQIYDETAVDGSRALKDFDIEVNQSTSYNQKYPKVTSLSDGDYVVVWESDDSNTGNSNIYAQKVTRLGNLSGSEVQINSATTYSQNYPTIAGLASDDDTVPGGFVVSFMSEYDDDGAYDIKYRIFTSDMEAYNGSDVSVTDGTTKTHGRINSIGLDDGGFLLAYFENYFANTENYEDGETVTSSDGTTAVIESINPSYPNKLHVTNISPGGLFHTGSLLTGSNSGNVEEIESASTTSAIFSLASGDQEITLTNNIISLVLKKYITSTTTVFFTIPSVNTTTLVDYELQLNTSPTDYTRDYTIFDYTKPIPNLSMLNDGNAIITWNNGQIPGIYYQKINISGQAILGDEKRVNEDMKGHAQLNPTISNVKTNDKLDMGYVISWQTESLDMGKQGIYMIRLDDDNYLMRAGNGSTDWSITNSGDMGLGVVSPSTQMHIKGTSPYLTLQSTKTEKGDALADSKIIMSDGDGYQLAEIKACYSKYYESPYPASQNLVMWYKFEETSGMITADHSNKTNTGTLRNFDLETHRVDGKIRKALQFDGVDTYIDCGDSITITGIGDSSFSISMWIKFPSSPPSGGTFDLISNGGTTNAGSYIFYINSSSQLVATLYTSAGAQTFTFNDTINDNGWHHVGMVYSSTDDTISVYTDGFIDTYSSPTMMSGTASQYTSSNVYIGSRDGSNNFYIGLMDDVRIYNTALTATQFYELYYNTAGIIGRIILKTNDGSSSFSDDVNNVTIDDKSNFRTLRVRGEPVQNISGSLSLSGTTVTGTSTSFTSEVMVGDQLYIDDTIYSITSIASDTSLTVDTSGTKTDSTPQKYPAILCIKDVDNTIQLSMDKDGNIGMGESNPESQLHMTGTSPYLTIENTTSETTNGGREGRIIFKGLNSSTRHSISQIESSHDGTSSDTQGKLTFYTNTGSALTEAMTLDSEGKLYIGNSYTYADSSVDPTAELEIASNLNNESRVLITNDVQDTSGLGTRGSHLYFQNKEAGTGTTDLDEACYAKITGSSDTVNTNIVGRLDFYTNNEDTMVSYMTIKKDGKVGIGGINEPINNVHMSHVYNSVGTASQSGTTVTGASVNFNSVTAGSIIVFNDNSSAVISEVTSSSTLTVTTSQTVSSQTFKIYYAGTSITSNGNMVVGTTTSHPSKLHVEGTMGAKVATVTGDTTLDSTYSVVLVNASGTTTITLPAVADSDGMQYTIKNIHATGSVTIDGNSSETIDGSTTASLASQYDYKKIVCDGSAWYIIGNN